MIIPTGHNIHFATSRKISNNPVRCNIDDLGPGMDQTVKFQLNHDSTYPELTLFVTQIQLINFVNAVTNAYESYLRGKRDGS